jgi:hypothetical protein
MTARIGKRTPTFEAHVPPSYWRQHLKPLAKWMLIVILASVAAAVSMGVAA